MEIKKFWKNLLRLARLPVPTFFTIFFITFILGWSTKGLKTFILVYYSAKGLKHTKHLRILQTSEKYGITRST